MDWHVYLSYGVAVFLGVVAGTVVNILTQAFVSWRHEKREVANLRFELTMDVKRLDNWLEELARYRNAVNSETLDRYFGWFDFDKLLTPTANRMLTSGTLYKYLSHEDIGDLQVVVSEISMSGTTFINNQIQQNKQSFNKGKAAQDVDFWETKLKKHRATLVGIDSRLSPKRLTR